MNLKYLLLVLLLICLVVNCDLDHELAEEQPLDLSHTAYLQDESVVIELNEEIYYETCTDYLSFYKVEDGERVELLRDPYRVDEAYYVDDLFYTSHYSDPCSSEEMKETDSFTESLLFAELTWQKEVPLNYSGNKNVVNVYTFTTYTGTLEFELVYFTKDTLPGCTVQQYTEYVYTGSIEIEE